MTFTDLSTEQEIQQSKLQNSTRQRTVCDIKMG